MTDKKMKIFNDEPFKIWTHYDLDGVGGPMLIKEFYRDQVIKTSPMGYGKMDAYIEQNEGNIFINDLSLTQNQVDKANENFNKVILFDHHPSSKTLNYPDHWTTYFSTKCCATKLIYMWLKHHNLDVKKTKIFVDHINDFDTWEHKIPACRLLNTIFWHLNFWEFEKAFSKFKWSSELWQQAKKLEKEKLEEIANFENYLIDDVLRVVLTDKHVSDIALFYTEQKHFLILKGKTCSIRSTLDLTDFYKELNKLNYPADGHANAGGIEFNEDVMEIVELFLNFIKKH